MKLIVLAIICLSVNACDDEVERKGVEQRKLVGGPIIDIMQAPYQASVENENGMHYCGGAIITDRHIVTAAHCLKKKRPEDLAVRVGTSNQKYGGQRIRVKRGIRHPQFNPNITDFDIAVLILRRKIKMSESVKTIFISQTRPKRGEKILVTGWSTLSEKGTISHWLRGFTVPVISNRRCQRQYPERVVTKNMFCAGYEYGGWDSCQGASGGPAVINGTLYGLISWGRGCGRPETPGVYTNIALFLPWVECITGKTLTEFPRMTRAQARGTGIPMQPMNSCRKSSDLNATGKYFN